MSTKNKVAVTAALLLCAAYVSFLLSHPLNLTSASSLGASIARMVLQIQISSQGLTDPFSNLAFRTNHNIFADTQQ